MAYELAVFPPAIFIEYGLMRPATNKSSLKKHLKVETCAIPSVPDAIIIDGSAIMWTISWPAKGANVKDPIDNFLSYPRNLLLGSNVYLIFDWSLQMSTKRHTRTVRANGVTRRYSLAEGTELPPKKQVLTATDNKKQLLSLIIERLSNNPELGTTCNILVVTGIDPNVSPFRIEGNLVTPVECLRTTQKEADSIIIHQLLHIVTVTNGLVINVICDD